MNTNERTQRTNGETDTCDRWSLTHCGRMFGLINKAFSYFYSVRRAKRDLGNSPI